MHIIGFGSEKQVLEIEKLIKSTSKKCTCKLTYDGLKNGKDYIDFIKNCNIGLSTQNPDASFNDTSFPSKILSYMCNGLSVVSADIPVISNSVIGKYIAFYKNQDPKEIADAIMSIDVNKSKNIKRIMDELDVGLRKSVLKLLIDD